jgi:hypothetical protein
LHFQFPHLRAVQLRGEGFVAREDATMTSEFPRAVRYVAPHVLITWP